MQFNALLWFLFLFYAIQHIVKLLNLQHGSFIFNFFTIIIWVLSTKLTNDIFVDVGGLGSIFLDIYIIYKDKKIKFNYNVNSDMYLEEGVYLIINNKLCNY